MALLDCEASACAPALRVNWSVFVCPMPRSLHWYFPALLVAFVMVNATSPVGLAFDSLVMTMLFAMSMSSRREEFDFKGDVRGLFRRDDARDQRLVVAGGFGNAYADVERSGLSVVARHFLHHVEVAQAGRGLEKHLQPDLGAAPFREVGRAMDELAQPAGPRRDRLVRLRGPAAALERLVEEAIQVDPEREER